MHGNHTRAYTWPTLDLSSDISGTASNTHANTLIIQDPIWSFDLASRVTSHFHKIGHSILFLHIIRRASRSRGKILRYIGTVSREKSSSLKLIALALLIKNSKARMYYRKGDGHDCFLVQNVSWLRIITNKESFLKLCTFMSFIISERLFFSKGEGSIYYRCDLYVILR